MKKIIIGLALLVSVSVTSEELVKDAEIISISTPIEIVNSDIAIIVTVKGGQGKCAGKDIRFPLVKMQADLYFETVRDTVSLALPIVQKSLLKISKAVTKQLISN